MTEEFVIDVDESSFESAVLEKSKQVPVLVDFWAAWCGPCRALGPVLERLASEYDGAFVLAKVDTDAWPGLAQRFGVRGLPTVKFFRDAQIVDEFVGAQPEAAIRPLLDKHVGSAAASPAEQLLDEARQLAAGNPEAAIELLRRATEMEPDKPELGLSLASLCAEHGRIDEAEALLQALPASIAASDQARLVQARARLARLLHQPLDEDDPHSKRLAEAARHIDSGRHDEGLALLAEILDNDRGWRDGLAREAMLAVFRLPEVNVEVVNRWRRRIASMLH